jgi:tetratricopeptide (TPR) repeat protein
MDPVTIIAGAAGIAGVLGFLYLAIVGQKPIPEYVRELKQRRNQKLLTGPAPTSASRLAHPQILHNLPQPNYTDFIGRKEEFEKIVELLSAEGPYFLVVIEGFSGLGKTSLAQAVCNHYVNRFADIPEKEKFHAVIWSSGKRKILTADGIISSDKDHLKLDDIFTTISIVLKRDEITRAQPKEQPEIVRTILAQQRTLLIVDSLETVGDSSVLEFLREIPAPTKVIVTTRQRIDSSYPIRLEPMTQADAALLIEQECQKKNVTSLSKNQKEILLERTNGVPIAIVWSISQISFGFNPELVLKRLADRQTEHDLAHFCFDELVEPIRGTDEFSALLSLSQFAGSASYEGIKKVSNVSDDQRLESAIVRLAKLSLITRLNSNYITSLTLTRTFAATELNRTPQASDYRRRVIEYYEGFTKHFGEPSLAQKTIQLELDNLKLVIDLAAELEQWPSFVAIVLNISRFLYVNGLYVLAVTYWDILRSLPLLTEVPELRKRAAKIFAQGIIYPYLKNERGEVALHFLKQSLPAFEEPPDYEGLSLLNQRLGIISRDLVTDANYSTAKSYLEQSYKYASQIISSNSDEELIKLRRQADALNGLGSLEILNGSFQSAREKLREADKLFQSLGDVSTRSSVIRHLAEIARAEQNFNGAARLCLQAIQLAQNANRLDRLADAYEEMAQVEFANQKRSLGLDWARKALEVFRSIGALSDAKRVEQLIERQS